MRGLRAPWIALAALAPAAPAAAPPAEPDAAAFERAAAAFVSVELRFAPDPLGSAGRTEERPARERLADRYLEEKRPLRWHGIIIDPGGRILIADPGFRLERIGGIRIRCRDGLAFPARVAAIYRTYGGLLLEPAEPLPRQLPAIAFEDRPLRFGERIYRIEPVYVSRDLYLEIKTARANLIPFRDGAGRGALLGLRTETAPYPGSLILDAAGTPVGYQVEYDLWRAADGTTTYAAEAIERGDRIPVAQWEAIRRRVVERLRSSTRKVRVYLRSVKDEEEEEAPSFSRWRALQQRGETVLELYGLAVPGGRLLVPRELERTLARKIEKVTVAEGGREIPVRYVGLYTEMGAFLVEAPPGIPPVAIEPDRGIRRGALFVVHAIEERFGRRYEQTDYNRYYNAAPGYRDRDDVRPFKSIPAGAFLLDEEGGLLGLYLSEKRPGEALRAASPYAYRYAEPRRRVFPLREIAASILRPEGALDPLAVPVSRAEAKRPVWLGVEYQPVSRDLMELLGFLGPTKDGAVGLLVTHVYEGSPAQRLGIAPGEVLLSVKEPGQATPVEFVASDVEDEDRRRPFYYDAEDFDEYGTNYAMSPRRIWRPRINYLTQILSRIGEGKRVTLAWVPAKEKAEKRAEIVLEKGPKDFDSADRWKDKAVGITVRDLTYEVRAVLRLAPDAPGVVVSRVEPGSKAQIGRIQPFELIARVDDRPVSSVAAYRRAVGEALAAGRRTLRLQVLTFGASRIVTIDLASPAGPRGGPPPAPEGTAGASETAR